MAKFMWTGSYTAEGSKGIIAEGGSSRKAMVEKMAESLGCKLECMYFALGTDDIVIIMEGPDTVTAASISLTVAAAGAAKGRLTVLMTAEEVDRAAKMSPAYRPPGK